MITSREWRELIKAWLATALAFGILIWLTENDFWFSFWAAMFTVGLGFILHELAHKYVAFKFRKHAEFRANNQMLVFSILMSFFGVIIAAPGAVIIGGIVSRKESGMIAAAGPLANVILAILFLPLVFLIPKVAFYGFMINSWLALFNMIPVPGFDGQKILSWHKGAYFGLAAVALILNIFNIVLPNFTGLIQ